MAPSHFTIRLVRALVASLILCAGTKPVSVLCTTLDNVVLDVCVVDEAGIGIAGAFLELEATSGLVRAVTDERGLATLHLTSGLYKLNASAEGFNIQPRKVVRLVDGTAWGLTIVLDQVHHSDDQLCDPGPYAP